MLMSAFFLLVEPALNQALFYDDQAAKKLAKLENKKFSIVLTDLNITLAFLVIAGQVKLMTNTELSDCLVKTKLDRIKSLSDASVLTQLIKQDELELEGDLHIAQAYSNLFLENDIDWQEWLSKYVGDALAYKIANGIKQLNLLIQRKSADLDYTVSSLLVDELRVSPDQLEVSSFVNDVAQLSAKTERLMAEFAQIRKS